MLCEFTFHCPCEAPVLKINQTFDFTTGASWPTECRFHLDSPLPISLRPLAFPPLTPASCMPRSFFIGKKREMFEHPVFCLASQVMDLTIREYLPHSPAPPLTSAPFYFSLQPVCTPTTTSSHTLFVPDILWFFLC